MIKRTLCFSNPAYLSLKNAQLVIKLPEVEKADVPELIKSESVRTVPVEDIGVVVLDNRQITVTQCVLEALLANDCAVITCDSAHMPVGLMLPLCGNTTQSERFRNQIDASLPQKGRQLRIAPPPLVARSRSSCGNKRFSAKSEIRRRR